MNELESKFFQAYIEATGDDPDQCDFTPQKVIGIYRVDFVYGYVVVEIDGHEYHKTKEQRERDYKRERYLIRNGYLPVRFTGTEVFLDPHECVQELLTIMATVLDKQLEDYERGRESVIVKLKQQI